MEGEEEEEKRKRERRDGGWGMGDGDEEFRGPHGERVVKCLGALVLRSSPRI